MFPRNSTRRTRSGLRVSRRFFLSSLLASGMCLVDTPGIGSVFSGNTETTKDFIPQIDAAILVVGADPPISGEELALIEAVAANVDEILIVLNKIDRVSSAERQEASTFATQGVGGASQEANRDAFTKSARSDRLNNSADADDWNVSSRRSQSPGEQVRAGHDSFGGRAGHAAIFRFASALRGGTRPGAERANRKFGAAHRQPPTDCRPSRAIVARSWGAVFRRTDAALQHIAGPAQAIFESRVSRSHARSSARQANAVTTSFGPNRRRELMALAQAVARRHVMPWLDAEEAQAEELYSAVTQRFVNLVNGLLQRISEEQSADFSHLPKSLDSEHGFRTRSRFFFHDMITIAQPASPLLYSIDTLMGAFRIRHWFRKDAENFLEQLLDTNASRVQGDVEQRVVESRLRLESDVRKLLREVSASAEQALSKAKELMAAGTSAVENELERLRKLNQELNTLAGTS